jgi:3-hydroxyisobutyrate dehydrogenase
MVGYPADVEQVYFSEHGVLGAAPSGALLIDMTTSSPALAVRIAEAAAERGLDALDAPVSGGDVGARNASLTIMVGGSEHAFGRSIRVLETMGRTIVREGPAGAGQHTKMCNQIAIASGMVGVVESLAYAKAAGLDPHTVLEAIGQGAAGSWSLANLAPRMLDGDTAPGFYVKHFIKDMRIALDSAREMGLQLPGLTLAEGLYERLAELGYADSGTQSLYQLYVPAEEPAAGMPAAEVPAVGAPAAEQSAVDAQS